MPVPVVPLVVVPVLSMRAHVVSLVAVFLALAVGIVVGTTALNGPVLSDLQSRVETLTGDKQALEADLRAGEQRVAAQEQAAELLAPGVVGGRLSGQRVVLVSTPDAPARLREELAPLLTASGARLGASVRLRPALLDPTSSQLVDDLVAQVALPGVELPEGEPVERAAAQLAQLLLARPGVAVPSSASVRRALAAYQAEDLLDVTGEVEEPGTVAVLLTGDPAAEGEARERQTRVLVGLARALDTRGTGLVVAGTAGAARDGGLVAAVRADNGVADRVSTVDTADGPTGRLAVVLALQEQRRGGSGAYGAAAGAEAALPRPSGS